jgi:serine/threonine protein kinase
MDCLVCGVSNADSSKVCRSCGTPLSAAPPSPVAHTLPSGTALQAGKYVLSKVLGNGGFGITYVAMDNKLARRVAVKEFFLQTCVRNGRTVCPSDSKTAAEFVDSKSRFLEEARTIAKFHHPSIVEVFDTFEENNTAYMVMQFVDGRPLADLLKDGKPISENDAVRYVEEVGAALRIVHAAGMLHRDLKPGNIMLSKTGQAVLIDFGTARQFAKGVTSRMTATLTEGYAPLEQYGNQARFGPCTDIYSLGASLYELLTGQLPIQATDRAMGVALPAPNRLNGAISKTVNDAVLWALEMKGNERPQNVDEFLSALHSPRSQNAPSPMADESRNPYDKEAKAILDEWQLPIPLPTTRHDNEIAAIKQRLSQFERFRVDHLAGTCPSCHCESFAHVTGEQTEMCPVCLSGKLLHRKLDLRKCPVCREGSLVSFLSDLTTLCPVCRASGLREERRKKFGMSLDLWRVCPTCEAEFDVTLMGRVKFVSFKEDPYGFGEKHCGHAFTSAEWRSAVIQFNQRLRCGTCRAVFLVVEHGIWILSEISQDPFGVGRRYYAKARRDWQWAKLAAALPAEAGTSYCPECHAEFDFAPEAKTLKLRYVQRTTHSWIEPWLGRAVPVEHWYLMRAGKESLNPGWLCTRCSTEFDQETIPDDYTARLKLVRTSSTALLPKIGESMPEEDWRRLEAGIPTNKEREELERALRRLEKLKQDEADKEASCRDMRRRELQRRLAELTKKSCLEGHREFPRTSDVRVQDGERVRWESPRTVRMKLRSRQRSLYWAADDQGTLIVTQRRTLFVGEYGQRWERNHSKLDLGRSRVEKVEGKSVVVLSFDGLQRPIGFALPGIELQMRYSEGIETQLAVSADDLLTVLRSVAS